MMSPKKSFDGLVLVRWLVFYVVGRSTLSSAAGGPKRSKMQLVATM